jgi:uncharacterized protein with HEPN domain
MKHMLDAAKEAIGFCQDKNRKSLDADRQLVLALVKAIAVIELRKRNATIKAKKKEVPIVLYNHAE